MTIIESLNNYKTINGSYPNTLNEMISNYDFNPKNIKYENHKTFYILKYNDFRETNLYNSNNKSWINFD